MQHGTGAVSLNARQSRCAHELVVSLHGNTSCLKLSDRQSAQFCRRPVPSGIAPSQQLLHDALPAHLLTFFPTTPVDALP